jgi:type 2 lantibiotic biosynthesis protein LanM
MTAPVAGAGDFDASLGCLIASDLDDLAARLSSISGLDEGEQTLLAEATRETLTAVLHAKLTRLLLLELNAARVKGQLQAESSEERWLEFLAISSQPAFWRGIAPEYPGMAERVGRIVANRCAATLRVAQRFAADRSALAGLCAGPVGRLEAIEFGAGDSHQDGQAVALLRCTGGRVVYKPRSVAVDAALGRFVEELMAGDPSPDRIRVPRVIGREHYGWTEFVEHRHAADDAELGSFYRGVGHWLAVMRLVSGSDLHAENLIAHGGCPVVVDCETLFTPRLPPRATGLGQAVERAIEVTNGTVLATGLLPGRGTGLGWRGIDSSGLGGLPGEQPRLRQIDIVQERSDEARIGMTDAEVRTAQNLPGNRPALVTWWPEIVRGFDELTDALRERDRAGTLVPLLAPFRDCRIRVVPRATEVYAEVGRMLWHPVSLHKPQEAIERAASLLKRMAARVHIAPDADEVIAAEVADLLDGDVPFFTTLAGEGELRGPRGTRWLRPTDLVEEALAHWRAADLALERRMIRATLVSAYINQGWMPDEQRLLPARVQVEDLDTRRRAQAAAIMRDLVASAITGADGTVSWIAPVLGPGGWSVQPLEQDLYNGASGLVLLVAGYLREAGAGRADPIDGLDELLPRLQRTLRCAELERDRLARELKRPRPGAPGAYLGLASQIWTLLALRDWGIEPGDGLERACALAGHLPAAIAADTAQELLLGKAGAIVPLLRLAQATGQRDYLEMASAIGDQLAASAVRGADGSAHWRHEHWPEGIGGYAHGVTGIGWALTKLARATGDARHAQTAEAAFRFEDALWDEADGNWRDLRLIEGVRSAAAWCHGAVGIGLAHADLDPGLRDAATRERVQRAAAATWRQGMGWNHSLCHGDLGAVELLVRAIDAGLGPEGLTRETLAAHVIGSIETHGAVCGITRETFSPGLMAGLGGVAWQLLRLHPGAGDLPSVLTLAGGEP